MKEKCHARSIVLRVPPHRGIKPSLPPSRPPTSKLPQKETSRLSRRNHGARRRNHPRPPRPVPSPGPPEPDPPVRQAPCGPRRRPVHRRGDPVRRRLHEAHPGLGARRRILRRLRRRRASRAGRPRGPLLRAAGGGRVGDAGRAPPVRGGAGPARARGGVRPVHAVGGAPGAPARRRVRRVPYPDVRRGRRVHARAGRARARAHARRGRPSRARWDPDPARRRRRAGVPDRGWRGPHGPPQHADEPVRWAGHGGPRPRQLLLRPRTSGGRVPSVDAGRQDDRPDGAVGVPGQPPPRRRLLRLPPAHPDDGRDQGVAGRTPTPLRRVRLLRQHRGAGAGPDGRGRRGPLPRRQPLPVGGPRHRDRQAPGCLRGEGGGAGRPDRAVVPAAGGSGARRRGVLRDPLRLELHRGGAERGRADGGRAAVVGPADQRQVRRGRVARRRSRVAGRRRRGAEGGAGEVREGGDEGGGAVQDEGGGVEEEGEGGRERGRELRQEHHRVPLQISRGKMIGVRVDFDLCGLIPLQISGRSSPVTCDRQPIFFVSPSDGNSRFWLARKLKSETK